MAQAPIRSAGRGIGLPMLLFIIFLTLRLTDNIDWSWYWVASPLWITAGLVVLVAFCLGMSGALDASPGPRRKD